MGWDAALSQKLIGVLVVISMPGQELKDVISIDPIVPHAYLNDVSFPVDTRKNANSTTYVECGGMQEHKAWGAPTFQRQQQAAVAAMRPTYKKKVIGVMTQPHLLSSREKSAYHWHPKTTKDNQRQPKTTKDNQRQPMTTKDNQWQPKTTKDNQRQPKTAEDSRRQPKTTEDSQR